MSLILAVFGASGQQGGSVINHVLNDPDLSRKYKIRAITRDISSEKAKQLREKVEVVYGDLTDKNSLETALARVHTVFVMTNSSFSHDSFEIEYASGKKVADAALSQGVQYLIFSTLPSIKEISGGKYSNIVHFEAKAAIEQYIRGLDIKSAFYSPGAFMENFLHMPWIGPRKASDDTWVMTRHNSPNAKFPFVCASEDTGKFVGAVLAEPEKYKGCTFCGATSLYTMDEVAVVMSEVTGKTVCYKQISSDEWKGSLPFAREMFVDSFNSPEEFGYYGPDSENLVAWAVENARGRPTTLAEFFAKYPLRLI